MNKLVLLVLGEAEITFLVFRCILFISEHVVMIYCIHVVMPVFDRDPLLCTFSGSGDCSVSICGSERGRVDIPQGLGDQRHE